MIQGNTAVLVAAALKMGAIIAGTSDENCNYIYEFGRNLGIAFQIQDDYLDAFGDPETFGKQVGGDIIENKKTYLFLKAKQYASATDLGKLAQWFATKPDDPNGKIEAVKAIFNDSGASEAAREAIEEYTFRAFKTLEKMDIAEEKKIVLRNFGESLMQRNV
jgi:geranylgeranyl diphosphate synthase type II